jgi:Pyruvate/2-oxoacid:ferredoxin oxidoreductase gamma subunit
MKKKKMKMTAGAGSGEGRMQNSKMTGALMKKKKMSMKKADLNKMVSFQATKKNVVWR